MSVVIPLYNHEQYIDAAIESLIAQSVPPDEIIIVDDGSQDGSLQRVQQWAERDSRIVCWSHPNQGAHYTINAAIQTLRRSPSARAVRLVLTAIPIVITATTVAVM